MWTQKDRDRNKKYYARNPEKYKKRSLDYYHRRWKNNPEKLRLKLARNNLMKNFGMTLEQKDQMIIAQDNRCAICNVTFKDRGSACVDHNHKTGKIRQLLCRQCNAGLGCFKENAITIKSALLYIEKWVR